MLSWWVPTTPSPYDQLPTTTRRWLPRRVWVTAAAAGALRPTDTPVLPAGGQGELVLQRTVRCPADGRPPPSAPEVRRLRLVLETPAGPRAVVLDVDGLPRGSLDQSLQRACLHPPIGESVRVASAVESAQDASVVVRVDVANEPFFRRGAFGESKVRFTTILGVVATTD